MSRNRALIRWCLWIALVATGHAAASNLRAGEFPGAEPLRTAIRDLVATFPTGYPRGGEFLARLDRVRTAAEFESLEREALLANPLVCGRPLLFVVRRQYQPDHHNTETMFQTGEINTERFQGPGALKLLRFLPAPRSGGEPFTVTTLIDLPEGVARDPEVSYDGRTILFAMRRDRADDYHLYEIVADGSGLAQLTRGSGTSDIDPCYLPDGRILFTSTREPKYCMCNRHIMGNLFTIDAGGTNLRQIGHGTLHEGHGAMLPDGRVIYDRWEYVDRNFGNAQGLWTCNPDGTNHAVYYGNSTASPGAKIQARPVPGSGLVICTLSSCHDRPWGALALLDRRRGVDGRGPIVRTWPAGAINLVGHGDYDTFQGVRPKYEDPHPLSDKYFLCSRMTGRGEQMGIYLVDVFGNETLVHVEGPGCFSPKPLAPRPRPPLVPPRIDPAEREGTFYVADVYRGTGMERIPRGTVKRLRVVVSPEKRFWTEPAWDGGTGQQAPGMGWNDFNSKRILGSAPVEPDGSAYFTVPADTFVYFQLLDERGMMVQSMRSGTIVRPGQRAGYVGCHDNRRESVPCRAAPTALRRPPSRLEPWHGPARNFGYLAEVQPVLDRHCVSCHDYGKPAAGKLNLVGDLNACFNTSYCELRGKSYVRVVGAGPAEVQLPKTWGSHASPLVRLLLKGHGNPEIDRQVKLDPEGFDRIVTWIDINAPYYPEYAAGFYRNHPFGRSPIEDRQLRRLETLTGVSLDRHGIALADFTRPELSPCLNGFADKHDPKYREALAILRAGKQNLALHPRADMPGFVLDDPRELAQQCKYDALRRQLEGGRDQKTR
jgi:hypothetical protein